MMAASSGAVTGNDESQTRSGARGFRFVGQTLGLLVLLGSVSRVVGFLREMLLASYFGAGHQVDAFLVGLTLPGAVQRVAEELLGASLVPLFAAWQLSHGDAASWSRLRRLLKPVMIAVAALILAALLASRQIVTLLAPGLDPASLTVASRSFQILLPGLFFLVLGGFYSALLNYYHRFRWVAFSTLLSNVAGLLSVILLAKPIGVYSAAVGMTLGAVLLVVLQWPMLPRFPGIALSTADQSATVAEFLALAKPLAIGIFVFNLIPVVERFISSWLPAGGIARLNYAFKVDWLIYLVLVVPITTMAFPRLASAGAARDTPSFIHVLGLALKGSFFFILPAIVFILTCADLIIRLLFERGNFSPADTAATAEILRVYVLGLPGSAASLILFYAIYALKLTGARVFAGIAGLCCAAGIGWPLAHRWGADGIAATHVLNFAWLALLLGWSLHRALTPGWWKDPAFFAARSSIAGALTLPAVWLGRLALERVFSSPTQVAQAMRTATLGVLTMLLFVTACWLLRIADVRTVIADIRGLRRPAV